MSNRPFSNSTLSGVYIVAIEQGNSGIFPTLFTFNGSGSVWPTSCPQTVGTYSIDSVGNLSLSFALGTIPTEQGGCVGTVSSAVGMVNHDGGVFLFNVTSPANGYTGIGISQ